MDTVFLGSGNNVFLGGMGGDSITSLGGRDILVGDNGNATFDDTGVLTLIQTSDAAVVGSYDDTINADSGDNVILGGNGNDKITTLGGNDVVVGDNGKATFDSTAGASIIRDILSTDTGIGGDDIILVGDGNNIVLGGYGKDQITSGTGNDIGTGDSGHGVFNAQGVLTYITTISPEIGDVDTVFLGSGNNVFLGGAAGDFITSLEGNDILVGDNGNATFTDAGVVTYLTTSDPTIGGDDVIDAGAGRNIVFGGIGSDRITTLGGDDAILGDNGHASFTKVGILTEIITTQPELGGDDVINAGDGFNVVIAGNGNDFVYLGQDVNVVLGDNGFVNFRPDDGVINQALATDPEYGGNDTISAGSGLNEIMGGAGHDIIEAGGYNSNNYIFGDGALFEFDAIGRPARVYTVASGIGGNDIIVLRSGGKNFVVGGVGSDSIIIGDGENAVIGDEGEMDFYNGKRTLIETQHSGVGDRDYITLGSGWNTVIGGAGSDQIIAQNGTNLIFGDEAKLIYDTLGLIYSATSVNPYVAGDDSIQVGNGLNVIVGGSGSDYITTGRGWHVILGDNGSLIWGGAHVANVSTTYDGIGGDDLISVSGGNSLIFGGQGNDKIYDGDGDSFIVGDNGSALLNGGIVQFVTTNSFHHGQDDIIFGGAGDDTIFGGSGGDYINGGPGNNTLIGDQGRYDRNSTIPRGITLIDEFHGGDDVLIGGAGRDLIYGEAGDDTLYGGPGNDSLFGGIGNDKLFGGTGNDILVGGLGADFLDGGFGKDTLYVDFFDVWAGGLPFDTIVGGRFYGCGLKLIGKDADGSGLASPDSAAARLAASFERLRATSFTINSDSINRNYAYLQPSNIIIGASGEQAQQYCMDSVRWGGLGQFYFMLVARELRAPHLIGLGSALESQWSDIVIWFY